jgi:hypothetical protein
LLSAAKYSSGQGKPRTAGEAAGPAIRGSGLRSGSRACRRRNLPHEPVVASARPLDERIGLQSWQRCTAPMSPS